MTGNPRGRCAAGPGWATGTGELQGPERRSPLRPRVHLAAAAAGCPGVSSGPLCRTGKRRFPWSPAPPAGTGSPRRQRVRPSPPGQSRGRPGGGGCRAPSNEPHPGGCGGARGGAGAGRGGRARGGGRRGGGGRSPRDPPAPPGPGTRRRRQLRSAVALGAAVPGAQRRRGDGESSAGSLPLLPSRCRRGARPGAATGPRPPGQVRPLAVSGGRDAAEGGAEPRARCGRPLTCCCRPGTRRPGDAGRRSPGPRRRGEEAGGREVFRRAGRRGSPGPSRCRAVPRAAPEGAGGDAGSLLSSSPGDTAAFRRRSLAARPGAPLARYGAGRGRQGRGCGGRGDEAVWAARRPRGGWPRPGEGTVGGRGCSQAPVPGRAP